jgi:DNA replication and repair protein RecF
MILRSLTLQNFRNYPKQEFTFSNSLTVIVGPNAAGKSNLVEAISLLSTGKSFRTDKERQLVQFGKPIARIRAKVSEAKPPLTPPYQGENTKGAPSLIRGRTQEAASLRGVDGWGGFEEGGDDLEVTVMESAKFVLQKKYLVNAVSKRRVDFAGRLPAVFFTPLDLDIVSGQPGNRRRFLDDVLEQVDMDYRLALSTYTKALRQRNALLDQVQNTGVRNDQQFAYWDKLLITNGSIITQKREEVINYINSRHKAMFPFVLEYDKSIMSEERLLQYKHAEVGAGSTLVGPQRDDVIIKSHMKNGEPVAASAGSLGEPMEVKYFCSRGQQRLVTLELKLSQISLIKERREEDPLLVLDDIFSELDSEHINQVLSMANEYQTIITTTHKEFIDGIGEKDVEVVELGK